jgi:hypothetical protein
MNNFLFDPSPVLEVFKCNQCSNPIVDSTHCVVCHKRHCKTCACSCTVYNPTHQFPAPADDEVIQSLLGKCKDCDWSGAFHLFIQERHPELCNLRLVDCSHTDCPVKSIVWCRLNEHLSICQYSLQTCEGCNIELSKVQYREHIRTCPLYHDRLVQQMEILKQRLAVRSLAEMEQNQGVGEVSFLRARKRKNAPELKVEEEETKEGEVEEKTIRCNEAIEIYKQYYSFSLDNSGVVVKREPSLNQADIINFCQTPKARSLFARDQVPIVKFAQVLQFETGMYLSSDPENGLYGHTVLLAALNRVPQLYYYSGNLYNL